MLVLQHAIFKEAHPLNFNRSPRKLSTIKYIVIHYTGNINDTAKNNADYFSTAAIQTSAHFFVSSSSIYQSVKLDHAAYAVGIGNRKEPYFKWPSMWKKITNSNSVSIEICGSKTSREATDETKHTAAKLCADLLHNLNLSPSNVYRHYDVTGKRCPEWAVSDNFKWLEFMLAVNTYYDWKGDEDQLINSEENYAVFKVFMDRYLEELASKPTPEWAKPAMDYCGARGIINDGRASSFVNRAELATVLHRINA